MHDPLRHAPLFRTTLRLGLPLALGMMLHALVNLVDLMLVGLIGPADVAGVHVATTINFLPMVLGNGISVATLSMLSRLLGSGQLDEARSLSARSQTFMVVAGVLVGGLGALLASPCVDFQGITGKARDVGIHYLAVVQGGTVTMFLLMSLTASMRAAGETMMPVLLLLLANALNLVLDLVFMFGWDLALLDRPELGWAPGSAYATVLSRAIAAGIGIWWLRRKDHLLRLSGGLRRGPRSQRRQVLWLGIPQTLQMLARATSVIALTKIAIDVGGQDAVVALGVTTRLDMLVVFAAAGFASAATTLVGRQVGEGDWRRARVACWLAGLQGAMFATVFVTLFGLFAVEITGWFVRGAGEEVLFAASDYLRIAAWAHLPAAFCLAVTGGINGAGRTFWPMVADAAGHWLFLIPCVAFFASGQCELRPVWYAWIVGQGVLAIAFALLVRRLSR